MSVRLLHSTVSFLGGIVVFGTVSRRFYAWSVCVCMCTHTHTVIRRRTKADTIRTTQERHHLFTFDVVVLVAERALDLMRFYPISADDGAESDKYAWWARIVFQLLAAHFPMNWLSGCPPRVHRACGAFCPVDQRFEREHARFVTSWCWLLLVVEGCVCADATSDNAVKHHLNRCARSFNACAPPA